EWSVNHHTEDCKRDVIRGRESNYYIVCDKHDDRDDPRSWAKANPAMGYRLSVDFTARELAKLPPLEFDRERIAIGEWPVEDEAWEVISQERWRMLTNENPGFPLRPIAFAVDIAEDGTAATISAAWAKPLGNKTGPAENRIVIEIPQGCSRSDSGWVL